MYFQNVDVMGFQTMDYRKFINEKSVAYVGILKVGDGH
jgi:hypothetical protein